MLQFVVYNVSTKDWKCPLEFPLIDTDRILRSATNVTLDLNLNANGNTKVIKYVLYFWNLVIDDQQRDSQCEWQDQMSMIK